MQASTSPPPGAPASAAPQPAPAPSPAADSVAELAGQLLALWRSITRAGGVGVYAIFEELDLTLTQVKALCALSAAELTVKELAERLDLSLPGASRAVDALVERELIGRREDPADRRMKRLRCTDAGSRALELLDEARLAGLEQFTATLPPAQRRRLSGALRPILDGLAAEGRA
jgi:DNA-binding MarR family transcriptional regulator